MTKTARAAAFGCVSLLALMAVCQAQAAELRGVVVDAQTGAPLPGAKVTAGGRTTMAGSDGRFRLDGLEAGAQALTVDYVASGTGTVTWAIRG